MKIIFLDIDGVLNSSEAFERNGKNHHWHMLDETLVERFNKLVKDTGASVVLSSTWRLDPDWRKTLSDGGVKCDFLGRTPRMPHPPGVGAEWCERGKEIKDWMERNAAYGIEKYAIIDDDNDMLPEQQVNFFQTRFFKGGLTAEIAEKVLVHLN